MELLIDADVVFGYMDSTDWLHPHSVKFFDKAKENDYKLKTSAAVVLELAIVTKRDLPDKLFDILTVLGRLKIEILPVGEEILNSAFELMGQGFGIFDAFHAATAKHYGLAIAGTDHKYAEIDLVKIDPRDV